MRTLTIQLLPSLHGLEPWPLRRQKEYLLKAQLRLFDDEGQALQELLNKRAVAMVSPQPFSEFQALKYADKLFLPLAGKAFTKEPIWFALRKGDVDFLNCLNNWILVRNADG